ncbi:hypothetical protein EDD16DRAFT_1701227 [Pisolithus croceorrhizus]|nr:hypothetical protein EDD16DRAFT_1701227 [Pisolithus croceorrhizus]
MSFEKCSLMRQLSSSLPRDAFKPFSRDEEDEETMEWERGQLRQGGLDSFATIGAVPGKQVYKPAPVPPLTNLPELSPTVERLAPH